MRYTGRVSGNIMGGSGKVNSGLLAGKHKWATGQ
jgi:hypothetical protein